jgi:SNF2 family DNA or RNA helicase
VRLEAYLHRNRSGDRIAVLFRDGDVEHAQLMAKSVSTSRRFGKHEPLPSPAPADPIVHAAHYPLTVDKCREMLEMWGAELKVHGHLAAWYRQAVKEHTAQTAITKLTDAELPVLAKLYPEFDAYLKGDQRVTAQWIAGAYRNGGLLADEVGTGKTVGVVAGLIERQVRKDILIACPKISVRAVWYKEITKHTGIPTYACKGSRIQREKALAAFQADPAPQKILIIVTEMLRIKAVRDKGRIVQHLGYEYPALFENEWDAIVVDESHKMLGAMDVVKANLAGEGLRALSTAPGRLKLAVSATPFGKGGRVEALFGTLHWLWPDEYTSRWAWLERHFDVSEERVFIKGGGGSSKMVKKVGGLKHGHTEEAFWGELGPRVLRRTMEEVSPAHRGLKNFIEVLCELEGKQLSQYKHFSDDGELAVDGGIITTVGTLDFLTRARQFANGVLRKEGGQVKYAGESAKLDRLMAHLDQLEPGRKVVISSQYNEFLDVVCDRLREAGLGWYRLDGKTSDRERERIMNEFQGDELFHGPGVTCPVCHTGKGHKHGVKCVTRRPTIFLLNSQAGGVSITLDAAEELHQLDEMYPPEANTQLYGRIFRRGRAHEVFFYLYRAMGTIDETIAANVAAGGEAQLRLLDGRRGKEYVRELAKYNPEGK